MRAGVIRRPGSTHALPVLSERDRAGAFCVPHSVGVSRIRLSSAARSGDAARERVRWAGPLGTSHQHVHLACTTHMSVSHDMHVPRCPPRLASPRSRLGYNIVQYSPRSLARQAHEGRPCGAPFGAWLAALLLRFFFLGCGCKTSMMPPPAWRPQCYQQARPACQRSPPQLQRQTQ